MCLCKLFVINHSNSGILWLWETKNPCSCSDTAPCFYRSIRPVTWRPALRCAATPPGPPGCQSTSVKMGRGRSRDSDTPVVHCSLTPSSSSWARKRWRRGSAPTTALQPARLTVSAGNEPPTTHFLLCSVVSKLSQVFLVLSAASRCS